MSYNYDQVFEGKELEFDWFPDSIEMLEEISDYSEITDLKIEAKELPIDIISALDNENTNLRNDEIREDFGEGLDGAMGYVFSEVEEKLCGIESKIKSEYLTDYIDELNQKCEVICTNICNCSESELRSRVEQCVNDNGCVIATIDNICLTYDDEMESVFLDDGIKTIEIIGIEDLVVIAKDYSLYFESRIEININKFLKLNGIILEVFK